MQEVGLAASSPEMGPFYKALLDGSSVLFAEGDPAFDHTFVFS